MDTTNNKIIADRLKLQAILAEKGLPTKLGTKLNHVEYKIHTILANGLNFHTGMIELEIPTHLLPRLTSQFRKIWHIAPFKETRNPTTLVLFAPTNATIKTTVKTALRKDQGIFSAKVNQIVLHESWARYLQRTQPVQTETPTPDWTRMEQHAQKLNAHTKQQILDGKTFNAQKDNPWARKNLKNRNQN